MIEIVHDRVMRVDTRSSSSSSSSCLMIVVMVTVGMIRRPRRLVMRRVLPSRCRGKSIRVAHVVLAIVVAVVEIILLLQLLLLQERIGRVVVVVIKLWLRKRLRFMRILLLLRWLLVGRQSKWMMILVMRRSIVCRRRRQRWHVFCTSIGEQPAAAAALYESVCLYVGMYRTKVELWCEATNPSKSIQIGSPTSSHSVSGRHNYHIVIARTPLGFPANLATNKQTNKQRSHRSIGKIPHKQTS